MKMLDLFAGLEGWSEPWREAGHEVCSVDIDTSFNVDLHADILELHPYDLPWIPDVILASPPCETFSLMSVGHYWTKEHTPKNEKAVISYKLVDKTLELVEKLAPQAWLIENPRAKLRSMPLMKVIPRTTVWYCQYGLPFAKPTDLFGYVPGWTPRPQCRNGATDHIASPRGSRTGIQGRGADLWYEGYKVPPSAMPKEPGGHINLGKCFGGEGYRKALRAKVPYELSHEVMRAVEHTQHIERLRGAFFQPELWS